MSRIYLSRAARRAIGDLLEDVLEPARIENGESVVSYTTGWSDAAVAEEAARITGEKVSTTHVAGERNGVFGKLRPKRVEPAEVNYFTMQEQIERLQKEAEEVRSLVTNLYMRLGEIAHV